MSGLAEPTVAFGGAIVSPRGRAAADLWLDATGAMAADLASQSAALAGFAVLDRR